MDLRTHGRMGSLTHKHTDARTHVIKKNGVWKVRKPTRKKKRGKMKKREKKQTVVGFGEKNKRQSL